MSEQKVEEVSIDGDKVRIVITVDKKDLLGGNVLGYSARSEVQEKVTKLAAQEVFQQHKDEITKTVLTDVNWADLVRSEIAKKVIQEAARGNY